MQPMFRSYRAPKQFESDLHVPIAINTLAAHEIEKVVSFLPDKHRSALRWHYVWPGLHINAVRRELGVTEEALLALIDSGRDMVRNRLRERLVDVG
jgi:DNA-directed RNA polymerase specialized sigma24 family protein